MNFVLFIKHLNYYCNYYYYWAPKQLIRMISEGSCDNEYWSNAAKFSFAVTGINYTLKYIQIENIYF